MSAKRNSEQGSPSFCEALEGRTLLSASLGNLLDTYSPATTSVRSPATTKLTSRTYVTASASTTVVGQPVTLAAKVTNKAGTPLEGASVTFKSNGVVIGTGITNAKGRFDLVTQDLTVGSDSLVVDFTGSKKYNPSTSATLGHTTNKGNTTATVVSSSLTANLGLPITFTATISAVSPAAGRPKGSVQFFDGATSLGTVALNSKSRAEITMPALFLGNHTITVKYLGSSSFNASPTSPSITQKMVQGPVTTSNTGLKTATLVAGSGAGSVTGETIYVNYTGYLTNGTKFDSSLNPGRDPFSFTLGNHEVIQGWEEGMLNLKVGETRLLIVPPSLGYGSQVNGNIPANSTLYFIVNRIATPAGSLVVQGGTNHSVTISDSQTPSSNIGTAFGSKTVNTSTAASTFALSNGGPGGLSLTGTSPNFVQISGANPADFIVTQPNLSVSPVLFTITFKPKATGARSAVITIPSTDPNFPNFHFTVTGTGV